MNVHDCVSIKLYEPKQEADQIWPVDASLLTTLLQTIIMVIIQFSNVFYLFPEIITQLRDA